MAVACAGRSTLGPALVAIRRETYEACAMASPARFILIDSNKSEAALAKQPVRPFRARREAVNRHAALLLAHGVDLSDEIMLCTALDRSCPRGRALRSANLESVPHQ
jgi:hypothetical protein